MFFIYLTYSNSFKRICLLDPVVSNSSSERLDKFCFEPGLSYHQILILIWIWTSKTFKGLRDGNTFTSNTLWELVHPPITNRAILFIANQLFIVSRIFNNKREALLLWGSMVLIPKRQWSCVVKMPNFLSIAIFGYCKHCKISTFPQGFSKWSLSLVLSLSFC